MECSVSSKCGEIEKANGKREFGMLLKKKRRISWVDAAGTLFLLIFETKKNANFYFFCF